MDMGEIFSAIKKKTVSATRAFNGPRKETRKRARARGQILPPGKEGGRERREKEGPAFDAFYLFFAPIFFFPTFSLQRARRF